MHYIDVDLSWRTFKKRSPPVEASREYAYLRR